MAAIRGFVVSSGLPRAALRSSAGERWQPFVSASRREFAVFGRLGRHGGVVPLQSGVPGTSACRRNTGFASEYVPTGDSESVKIVQELLQGNKRYAAKSKDSSIVSVSFPKLLDHVVQSQLRPPRVKAIILLDARSLTAAPTLVSALPGEVRSVRIIGNVLNVNDGVAGAVEFLTEKFRPPVILVLGNSGNSVVESAVRCAMMDAAHSSWVELEDIDQIESVEDTLHLVRAVVPVAFEALRAFPRSPFEKLVEVTSYLHIWRTIENLLCSSVPVFNLVKSKEIQLHGAYLDNDTGVIRFLGEHPALSKLIQTEPLLQSSRTGDDPPVPADEALAQLVAGNARYASGHGGELKPDPEVRQQLSEHGQNPIAIILGCADSRAPTEIIYDMRPGDLFVLRNAGNTCSGTEGAGVLIGSVEYAIAVLRCKLIVVNGHTQCGAVTGAVTQVREQLATKLVVGGIVEVFHKDDWHTGTLVHSPDLDVTEDDDGESEIPAHFKGNFVVQRSDDKDGVHVRTTSASDVRAAAAVAPGSIGYVLRSIVGSARRAVAEMPNASLEEQVTLATKYNIHNSMKVLIKSSQVINQGVLSGEIQVHGSIYNLKSSHVEWLGQHPQLEDIAGVELPLYKWKASPYVSSLSSAVGRGIARPAIKQLREGNRRFVVGNTQGKQTGGAATGPSAIILASPEINFPIESMFDAVPGSVVVQRALGGLQEQESDMLQASIEYMVLHFKPSLLLVIGDSDSRLVDEALEQIHGMHAASSKTVLSIFSGVLVSALRAVTQEAQESEGDTTMTEASKEGRMKRLAVELNALYTIEQLLLFSKIISDAVRSNQLEIHVGLLDEHTGEVEFIGEHPMQKEIMSQRAPK